MRAGAKAYCGNSREEDLLCEMVLGSIRSHTHKNGPTPLLDEMVRQGSSCRCFSRPSQGGHG